MPIRINRLGFFFLIHACLIACMSFGQGIEEDFEDGDLSLNPVWQGDLSEYSTEFGELKLQSVGTGKKYLSTSALLNDTATWKFYVRLPFPPSSVNAAVIMLSASESNLLSPSINGLAVRIGVNGTGDGIELQRIRNGQVTRLYSAMRGAFYQGAHVRVSITRSQAGLFSFFADTTGGNALVPVGIYQDSLPLSGRYYGIVSHFTSTRSQNIFYDDLYAGPFRDEHIPPRVVKFKLLPTRAVVQFSEPVRYQPSSLSLQPGNRVSTRTDTLGNNTLSFVFGTPVDSLLSYQATLSTVEDVAGNPLVYENVNCRYYAAPRMGTLLISEVKPGNQTLNAAHVPSAEFIELHNPNLYGIELDSVTLADATLTPHLLPSINLEPDQYLVLAGYANASLFPTGTALGMSLPGLNDDGDQLTLKNKQGLLIDGVSYQGLDFMPDHADRYSLERIDAMAGCPNAGIWAECEGEFGATPGLPNSLHQHVSTAPVISTCLAVSATDIKVVLIVAADSVQSLAHLSVKLGGVQVPYTLTFPSSGKIILIHLLQDSLIHGTSTSIELMNLASCNGELQTGLTSFTVLLPLTAQSGKLKITEILFNPYPLGVDFVELYNPAEFPVNLAGLKLKSRSASGTIDMATIPENTLPIEARGYVYLATSITGIRNFYPNAPEAGFRKVSLPSLPDDEATLILQSEQGQGLDSIAYTEQMHLSLLNSREGVSLEKVMNGEWVSAAESAGFATPGMRNSHELPQNSDTAQLLSVNTDVISPNGDGKDDLCAISLNPNLGSNSLYSLYIVTPEGQKVRTLARNASAGSHVVHLWDGLHENGSKALCGPYMLIMEAFNTSGQIVARKLPLVVSPW